MLERLAAWVVCACAMMPGATATAGNTVGQIRTITQQQAISVELSPGQDTSLYQGFDTMNGARRLLRVDMTVAGVIGAKITVENDSSFPASGVALNFFVFGEVMAGQASLEIDFLRNQQVLPPVAASDGVPMSGDDFADGGFVPLTFESQSSFDDPDSLSTFTNDTVTVSTFIVGGWSIANGADSTINVTDFGASASILIEYVYIDTLVQPFTQRQFIDVTTLGIVDETPFVLEAFDDVGGERDFLRAVIDTRFGVRADLFLEHTGADISDLLTVLADGVQQLDFAPTLTVNYNLNRFIELPGVIDTVDLRPTDFDDRAILTFPADSPPAALFLAERPIIGTLRTDYAIDVLGSRDIETTVEDIGTIAEFVVDYNYALVDSPLGEPNFATLFPDGVTVIQSAADFGGPVNAETGLPLDDIVVAVDDLDPGKPDEIVVFINQGPDAADAFEIAGAPIQVGLTPSAIGTGDLTGDGEADIIVTTADDNLVWVFANDGAGAVSFTALPPIELTPGDEPGGFALYDINDDDLLDLAVIGPGNDVLRTLLNDIDRPGNFMMGLSVDIDDPLDVCPIDDDNDRDLDGAVAVLTDGGEAPAVAVIGFDMNDAPTINSTVPTGASPTSLSTIDLNDDGFSDFLVSNSGADTFWFLANDATGGYNDPFIVVIEDGAPGDLTTGDFDDDGDDDVVLIVVNGSTGDRADFYEADVEDGAIILRPPQTLQTLNEGTMLLTGDFNGDAVEDLAIIESDVFGSPLAGDTMDGLTRIGVFTREFDAGCAADIAPLGGNGIVNVDDILEAINLAGVCPPAGGCPGDISPALGDGFVDMADIVAVINAFGPCEE